MELYVDRAALTPQSIQQDRVEHSKKMTLETKMALEIHRRADDDDPRVRSEANRIVDGMKAYQRVALCVAGRVFA